MVNLTINDQKVSVPAGTTVLAAAKKLNINIPTFVTTLTFVLQVTAGYVLWNRPEQGHLLHHVQRLFQKGWIFIQILLK